MSCPDIQTDKENYLHPEIGLLKTPFKHIALAMSGGGFRAGTFSLGVLSYLKQVPYFDPTNADRTLLENVTYLSSASGGTITTSTYALSVANARDFNSYYAFMTENMTGNLVMEKALEILNDKHIWHSRPAKSRNIINSFALAYDDLLLEHQKVSALKMHPNPHLEEVCFNTTELYNGLLFRQSIKLKEDTNPGDKDHFLYGNYKLHLDHEVAEHLHLSDLLAASSCFPGGFEPVVFPGDFVDDTISKRALLDGLHVQLEEYNWSELNRVYGAHVVERVYNAMPKPVIPADFMHELKKHPIQEAFKAAFMDGGITDNQGLESMIQANKRRAAGRSDFKPFDLMMVCDVDSHYIAPFELPEKASDSKLTISKLILGSWIVTVISSLTLLAILTQLLLPCRPIAQGIVGTVSGILAVIGALLLFNIYRTKKKIATQVNGSGIGLDKIFSKRIRELLFRYFGKLPLSRLSFMIKIRITSLIYISSNVFMARIRYLLYDQFFNQGNLKRTGRVKSIHIYDLAFSNDCNRRGKYTDQYEPSEEMQIIAEYAMNMATTLWFSKDGQHRKMQAAITACGQFTTCFNLLDYIWKLKKDYNGPESAVYKSLDSMEQQRVDTIEKLLSQHFERFKSDPFWLYNDLGVSTQVKDFYPVDMSIFSFPAEFKGLR